ncbi:FUSC family protein [Bordetella genomosp. 13]|uniref:Fusaric acid resistance protein n=1 Tax=Bordetella genomosp. 13 TaxID=463040 RepID=A0A1W6ZEZ4_9BORD|nr:FUSC family protein [Bordetella genomosp. 13]ARP95444.1 fusaric acid resistance protein [Bordetella genomosp. 13]
MKRLPSAAEYLFSAKCYAGAMLALYLSYSIGLPRPFWSVTTAYVVSQPWSGAVRSKALYRLGGTFFGSAMVVYTVPRLANYPVLMTLAMALWVGICLYISVLDRTPRSYLFMLAGYTAALIGFPSVTAPSTVFDTGLARVEEITLGILCASLVHSVVLPQGIGRAVIGRLDATLRDARDWVRAVLDGDAARQGQDRRQLANDITQLRLMSTHVPFDTGNIRWTANALRVMQDRLAALTPSVSAVEDRLQALQEAGQPLPQPVAELLARISAWVGQGKNATTAEAASLRRELAALTPPLDHGTDWPGLLQLSLLTRVGELIDAFEQCLLLREDIHDGLRGAPRSALRMRPLTRGPVLHRDRGIALWSALAAGIAIAVCCLFWIGTAWTNGSTAAMMAVVFSCFFAAQDNPVPGIMQFLKFTVYSIPLSALYLLGILPAVHSFEMLALTLFPVAFVLGALIARPEYTLQGMALLFGVTGTLALHDTNTADLVSFLDATVGQILGVATAAIVAAIFRTASADWSARRIQAANWDELAELAASPKARSDRDAYAYASRLLDRIGLLQPRLAMATRRDDLLAADALKDLRVGKDIVELQHARRQLPVADAAIQQVLRALAEFFRARRTGRREQSPELLAHIDRALAGVAAADGAATARSRAAVALVGIRRALYPQASAARHPASESAP